MKRTVFFFLCLTFTSSAIAAGNFDIQQGTIPAPPPTPLVLKVAKPAGLGEHVAAQLARCWSVPRTENAPIPTLLLDASLDRKGTITAITLNKESEASFQKEPAFREIALATIMAVKKCSPIHGLPEAEHEKWKRLQLKLDANP